MTALDHSFPPQQDAPPKRYVFLLLEKFANLGFASALEALGHANCFDARTYYSTLILSETGQPVTSSSGVSVNVDGALQALDRRDTIVVCGGDNIALTSTPAILNWLRREARKGTDCGAITSAAYTLAIAGLLTNKRATTHWQHHGAFNEGFPNIELQDCIFCIDNNRFTCAGGTSAIDLMLHLIAQDNGPSLANWIADQMIYTSPRAMSHTQRLSIHYRTGARHLKFSQAIDLMRGNLENPFSPANIAQQVGISTRQLERLFRKYLKASPKNFYLQLRLEQARNLLLQTNMSIMDVCLSTGFNSASHFSKCYRKQFGDSPKYEKITR